MIVERKNNFSWSYMCTADPTGLPYSFGTDSLQPHLITYTGTPGNHNCLLPQSQSLLRVHIRIDRRDFFQWLYMCTADQTGLLHSFGTDSLQAHLITHTGTPYKSNHNRLLRVYIRLSEENVSRSYMCTADPTGLPYSFGTDSLQPHLITYTGTPGNHNRLLYVCIVTLSERTPSCHIGVIPTQLAYRF